MLGLWKGARKMPKRRRWLIGFLRSFMMGPSFGLLIRNKLALDPSFLDGDFDRYDSRSTPRTATRGHLSSKLQKAAAMPWEPPQGKQQMKQSLGSSRIVRVAGSAASVPGCLVVGRQRQAFGEAFGEIRIQMNGRPNEIASALPSSRAASPFLKS